MIETYYFCFLVLFAGVIGYAIPLDSVRRMKDRLHLAERSEDELRRELAVWRVKVSEGTAKIDQLAHEIATRSTASEDQARLGALLHKVAELLGVREEAFGGIAEEKILGAAARAKVDLAGIPVLQDELAEAEGDLTRIHRLCNSQNIPAGPASARVEAILCSLVKAQHDLAVREGR